MKKIVWSLVLLTPAIINSLGMLKKAVPKGVSPSQSRMTIQKLKQQIQSKAPKEEILKTLTQYKRSFQNKAKPLWNTWEKSVPSIPQVASEHDRALIRLENALKKDATYETLENIIKVNK